MDELSQPEDVHRSATGIRRFSGPALVGIFFAALAIVLTLVGLWREGNLSLRNILLGTVLGGGTWGLISWAISTAVVQVEEDLSSRGGEDT